MHLQSPYTIGRKNRLHIYCIVPSHDVPILSYPIQCPPPVAGLGCVRRWPYVLVRATGERTCAAIGGCLPREASVRIRCACVVARAAEKENDAPRRGLSFLSRSSWFDRRRGRARCVSARTDATWRGPPRLGSAVPARACGADRVEPRGSFSERMLAACLLVRRALGTGVGRDGIGIVLLVAIAIAVLSCRPGIFPLRQETNHWWPYAPGSDNVRPLLLCRLY